jgi:hypothetical protein
MAGIVARVNVPAATRRYPGPTLGRDRVQAKPEQGHGRVSDGNTTAIGSFAHLGLFGTPAARGPRHTDSSFPRLGAGSL